MIILEKELARGINIERAVKFFSDQMLDNSLKMTKIMMKKKTIFNSVTKLLTDVSTTNGAFIKAPGWHKSQPGFIIDAGINIFLIN